MDKLRAMEVLVAAVEAGTLSAAATRLGLSNAAVTAQLQGLEAHLQTTLLYRSTRHLRVTQDGEAFVARSRAILSSVAEAEAEVGTQALHGVLRVQVPIAVGHMVLAPALAEFSRLHPALRVVTMLDNEVGRLGKTAIDIAIRIDEVEALDLVARPIYSSRHVVCAAPDVLAGRTPPRSPLEIGAGECLGWVAGPRAVPRAWRLRRGTEEAVVRPEGGLSFNSSDALLGAAAQGAGFAYVLDLLARKHLQAGSLVAVLPDWETEEEVFYVTYPKTRFVAPKVRAFAEFAAHAFPKHLRPGTKSAIRVRRR